MKKLVFLISLVFIVLVATNISAKTDSYRVYFLNSKGWTTVKVYAYFHESSEEVIEPFGRFEQSAYATKEAEDSLWWYIDLQHPLPLSFIFHNGGGDKGGDVYISDTKDEYYLTIRPNLVFDNKEDALAEMEGEIYDPTAYTTLWFYNTDGWFEVYGYVFGTIFADPSGVFPGTKAARDGNSHWYKLDVYVVSPFYIIFTDKINKTSMYIESDAKVYCTVVSNKVYSSKMLAEATIENILPIPDTEELVEVPQSSETTNTVTIKPKSNYLFYYLAYPLVLIPIILLTTIKKRK